MDPADAQQWRKWTQELGWLAIVPTVPDGANADARVEAVAAAVKTAIKEGTADPAHVYIVGRAEASAASGPAVLVFGAVRAGCGDERKRFY